VDGAVVQADHSGDKAMYGSDVTHEEILGGKWRYLSPLTAWESARILWQR
jgi:lipid-binding SYLF domain-containing protein